MAGLNPQLGDQLRAIAVLRWRLFVNSLRSTRGRLNLLSRTIAGLLVFGAAFGGAILLVVLSVFGFDFDTVGRRRADQRADQPR